MKLPLVALTIFTLGSAAKAENRVGPGAAGLPALGHVAVAEPANGVATVGFDASYQLVERLPGDAGVHHAGSGVLGVAVPVSSWAIVGASAYGAYTVHPADELGADASGTGYPALHLRAANTAGPITFGCELTGLFPGRTAPSVDVEATSLLVTALASYAAADSPWIYSVNLGYTWDNSAAAAPPIATLRQGDRVALGASSHDAVRVGVAAAVRSQATLFFGEYSADILYAAASPSSSPMRLAMGVRHTFSDAIVLEARGQVGLSARQAFDPTEYQPYEPRFAFFLGPRFVFGASETRKIEQEPKQRITTTPRAARPATYELAGLVVDEHGAPLSQVQIRVAAGSWTAHVETGTTGTFRVQDVPGGQVVVTAETVDYQSRASVLRLNGAEARVTIPTLQLENQRLSAQVEGVVRTRDGTPLAATITLQPGASELSADGSGTFRIEVTPGTYQVTISAAGYEPQTRSIVVETQGVVIVNAELTKR